MLYMLDMLERLLSQKRPGSAGIAGIRKIDENDTQKQDNLNFLKKYLTRIL